MEIKEIPIDKIRPDKDQPRKTFSPEPINGLAETIKKHGLMMPIEIDENNIITFGERRWRAAKKAGLKTIPCVVKKVSKEEKLERQLIEDATDEALPLKERDKAWKRFWNYVSKRTGPVELPHNKKFFANLLGVSEHVVDDWKDRIQLEEETGQKFKVAPSTISETQGLEKKERLQLLKTAEKEDIGSRKIREYVTTIKSIPKERPDIKKDLLAGHITPIEAQTQIREYEQQTPIAIVKKGKEYYESLVDDLIEELNHTNKTIAIFSMKTIDEVSEQKKIRLIRSAVATTKRIKGFVDKMLTKTETKLKIDWG